MFTFVLVSNPRIPCYIYQQASLRFVTSCYIFIRENFCETSFPVHFCTLISNPEYLVTSISCDCYALLPVVISLEEKKICEASFHVHFRISFQPTNRRKCLSNQLPGSLLYQLPTPEYLVTYISWPCYVFLPVVISLEEIRFAKLVSMFNFVLVSNPEHLVTYIRWGCYVLLSVVISLEEKMFSFQVHFCIRFQPPNTLLHMFIWLVKCCFKLLHRQKRKSVSHQFPG